MKREPRFPDISTSADLCSGTADILDSYDDVLWDELCDLSTDFASESRVTPIDLISGASPVKKNSNVRVQSFESCSNNAATAIHNDRQFTSCFGRGASFNFNPNAARNPSQLQNADKIEHFQQNNPRSTWPVSPASSESTISTSDSLSDPCTISTADKRRQKNREWMRKARQKQREELDNMKITVARLEKQYAELSVQASSGGKLISQSRVASDYTQAVDLSRRLGAENLYLKSEIQQQATWKLNLSRVLQSRHEVDGPRWAQQFQQPALGGEAVLRMQLDILDEFDAREEFGFHPLSDLNLTHVILENSRTIARVQSRLMIPSSSDTDYGARTTRMQAFGWNMVQRVQGQIMECVFTKKFYGLNVADLMQKTWANDMRLGEYKKVKGETCRLEVLQQVNPNAYVVGRDVVSPTEDIATFRSVYVRFLIETSRRLPASNGSMTIPTCIDANAPTTPPQYADSDSECEEVMLEAKGFILGTQSIGTDYTRIPREKDIGNKVAWAHISLSIEFLNVVNPVTHEVYQQLRWSGRTDYCGPHHAIRNASDMMQGLLRWELLVISPALKLVSLSIK
ncbi:hypothetical protein PHMEG_00011475 [Phytophthora megakarya]|uniref:BZIP domain-containing protein n=1 Tax=Phytophthora megakarya TaxID=4795 RepID=A0A225WCV4_9STRA|nr:hypothetical protein PHMEG_00011475 [Phytophthora megakarya]